MHETKTNRIFELDALRGIAALFVIFFHYTLEKEESKAIFKYGVTGVDLFFIISGFVILLTLEKTQSWKDFVFSRFSRLYPTYWICVTLTTLAILTNNIINSKPSSGLLQNYLANLTMFQKYFMVTNLDGSYWTMLIEMIFYIYMLIIFLTGKLKQIIPIGTFTLIPVFVYGISFFSTNFSTIYNILRAGIPLINHFPLFFAGILFYKLKFQNFSLSKVGLLALCFCCQLVLFDDGGASKFFLSFREYTVCLICYFIVFSLYITRKLNFIVNKFTIFLGTISYSVYLIHQYISTELLIPTFIKYLKIGFWPSSIVSLLAILAISSTITLYMEKPILRFLRNKWKERNNKAELKKSVLLEQ